MKKLIALLLLSVMLIGVFCGCSEAQDEVNRISSTVAVHTSASAADGTSAQAPYYPTIDEYVSVLKKIFDGADTSVSRNDKTHYIFTLDSNLKIYCMLNDDRTIHSVTARVYGLNSYTGSVGKCFMTLQSALLPMFNLQGGTEFSQTDCAKICTVALKDQTKTTVSNKDNDLTSVFQVKAGKCRLEITNAASGWGNMLFSYVLPKKGTSGGDIDVNESVIQLTNDKIVGNWEYYACVDSRDLLVKPVTPYIETLYFYDDYSGIAVTDRGNKFTDSVNTMWSAPKKVGDTSTYSVLNTNSKPITEVVLDGNDIHILKDGYTYIYKRK